MGFLHILDIHRKQGFFSPLHTQLSWGNLSGPVLLAKLVLIRQSFLFMTIVRKQVKKKILPRFQFSDPGILLLSFLHNHSHPNLNWLIFIHLKNKMSSVVIGFDWGFLMFPLPFSISECRWHNQDIVILGEVTIKPPYGPKDIHCVEGSKALAHISKIVSNIITSNFKIHLCLFIISLHNNKSHFIIEIRYTCRDKYSYRA